MPPATVLPLTLLTRGGEISKNDFSGTRDELSRLYELTPVGITTCLRAPKASLLFLKLLISENEARYP
jgi:hypothetical protein